MLETSAIPKTEARRIESLVEAADFFRLPAELPEARPIPDSFQYTLTIQRADGTEHAVTFSDASATAPLLELKKLLRAAR